MRVDVEKEQRRDLNKQLMGRAHKDITYERHIMAMVQQGYT